MSTTLITRAELSGLEWVVQYRYRVLGDGGRWESIAAFNSDIIAKNYAKQCTKDNKRLTYRVLELSAIQPISHTVWETEK